MSCKCLGACLTLTSIAAYANKILYIKKIIQLHLSRQLFGNNLEPQFFSRSCRPI